MNQRPIIGIVLRVEIPGKTGKLVVEEKYRKTIIKHGGNVIGILPPQLIDYTITKGSEQEELTAEEKEMLITQLKMVDGLLLPGGFKINKFDRFIVEYAIENNIPMLGICLGMQTIAYYKSDLILEKNDSFINHDVEDGYAHSVTIDKGSKLFEIIGKEKIDVISRHAYHVTENSNVCVSAVSDDNIIEAVEISNNKFCIGLQWHPELSDDEPSNKIFDGFINSCKK